MTRHDLSHERDADTLHRLVAYVYDHMEVQRERVEKATNRRDRKQANAEAANLAAAVEVLIDLNKSLRRFGTLSSPASRFVPADERSPLEKARDLLDDPAVAAVVAAEIAERQAG